MLLKDQSDARGETTEGQRWKVRLLKARPKVKCGAEQGGRCGEEK